MEDDRPVAGRGPCRLPALPLICIDVRLARSSKEAVVLTEGV